MKRAKYSGDAIEKRFARTIPKTATLEELRMMREVALKYGDMRRAFAIATAIDIKRGLYS